MDDSITDIEAADAFVQDHSDDAGYVEAWGKWVIWKGERWAVGQTAEIESKAESTVRKFEYEANLIPKPDERKQAIRRARRLQSDSRIRAILNRAKARIAAPSDTFDKNPWLLNTYTGTVDLETGSLHNHRREDYLTQIALFFLFLNGVTA